MSDVAGGLETTQALLGSAWVHLARHPDQRADLAANLQMMPGAIEEMLRYFTPQPGLARVATRDAEVGGVTIRQGDKVFTHVFGEKPVVDELDPMKLRWDWAFGWDRVELGMQLRFGAGVLREEVESPGEGVRGRLVAGEKEGDELIADLLLAEPAAVTFDVAGLHENLEEIAALAFRIGGDVAFALVDDAVRHLVE